MVAKSLDCCLLRIHIIENSVCVRHDLLDGPQLTRMNSFFISTDILHTLAVIFIELLYLLKASLKVVREV